MARGNSRAQSEAGTNTRTRNYKGRLEQAMRELARADQPGYNATEQIAKVQEILATGSGRDEKYEISVDRGLVKGGKLNMMDATIDGKEINNEARGAFARTFTKSRASDESDRDFNYEASRANIQQGFIFAKDEKGEIFALPHSWDTNKPDATVGVFRGDTIKFLENPAERQPARNLEVIGTFDYTKRGLNLAAAAVGDAIGRKGGIKQTATILTIGSQPDFTRQDYQPKVSVIPDRIIDNLNGDAEYRSQGIGIKRKEG